MPWNYLIEGKLLTKDFGAIEFLMLGPDKWELKATKKQIEQITKWLEPRLNEMGMPAVEPLNACLKHEDSSVRKEAAYALGKLGDARAGGLSGRVQPRWNAPATWQEVPGGQFFVAKFVIAGADQAQATVNVSSSPGDGGGLFANVNRWREQLGLNALPTAELEKTVTKLGDQIAVAEMTGTVARAGQPAAIVGAIVFLPGQAWFYKLMGDAAVVTAEKPAFLKFVQEAQP
jgi:hypothetical protein